MATTTYAPITQIDLTFGERLAWLRGRRGLTQAELAYVAGISENSVGAYERDESRPRRLAMRALSEALTVSYGLLAEGQDGPEPPINLADRRSKQGDRASLCTAPFTNMAEPASLIAA